MKTKFTLVLLLSVSAMFTFQSCGDDEAVADVLVTSNRQTGVFYQINTTTGATTEIFTPTIDGSDLMEIRAFVYHPGEKLFYASLSTEEYSSGTDAGHLYSMDPKTKEATLINDNNGGLDWYAITNWAVTEDDSLIGIGYFRSTGIYGSRSGILKFGTNGEPALKLFGIPEICCGNGMLYDKSTGIMQVGSGENTSDGEIAIEAISNEGVISNTTTITTFTDFPDDLLITWLTLKAMAKDKKGNVFGILFHYDLGKSYLVKIDIEGEEVTYISTLGLDYDNQYNTLAFIPGNFAK